MLKLVNIKKYYDMGEQNIVKALDGVSFELQQGEFVCVVGPSGSGKSTMMNILGCLDVASEGEYYVDGIEISKFNENQLAYLRNKKFGFIFQGFNLLPKLNAIENVELPLIYQGVASAERKKVALKCLELVGMQDRANHKPSELSGGQQQRVAIARAIATNPRVILADEPTGNLDTKSGDEVMKILKSLNKQGTTIIIITHNHDIANDAKRVLKILDGKIVEDSTPNSKITLKTVPKSNVKLKTSAKVGAKSTTKTDSIPSKTSKASSKNKEVLTKRSDI